MAYEFIKYEIEDSIGIITLNRPECKNAVNIGMLRELDQLIDDIKRGEAIRVVIVTGAPDTFIVS